jgi:hypothetical protein
MSRQVTVQECDQEVQRLFPFMPRPEQKALAGLVTGVACQHASTLSQASAAVPGAVQDRSKLRRAQRLLANDRLDLADAQAALRDAMVAGRRGRLTVLLDETVVGATKLRAGTTTYLLAVAWRRRALPIGWRTVTRTPPEHERDALLRELCTSVATALPADLTVVLLADRGLSGAPLAHLCADLGWHYLVRVQRTTRLALPTGEVRTLQTLVARPGTTVRLADVRVYAPRTKVGRRWVSAWDEAVVTNVVGVWRPGDDEPWLLLTDLPPTRARCSDYRHRTWEEELFRDLKSLGWGWDQSRVRVPARVARLVLVLTLATVWMLALGQRVIKRGWRPLLEERSRRCYSYFQLGCHWVTRCLANNQSPPCTFHLWFDPLPAQKLS